MHSGLPGADNKTGKTTMLQAMRDRVMGILGWIIIGLIIMTFALFGLGSYLQNRSHVYAAKVNDTEISPRELQIAYQNQRANMQRALGDSFDPALIDDEQLRKQALDSLIQKQLILQAAKADGMAVSDQLLAARIHSISAFQQDGKFDQDRYQSLLFQQGQTPAGFEHETRELLTVQQLINGVSNTAFVTGSEIDRAYSLQEQTRSFDYIVVAADSFADSIVPDEEEIAAYYQQHSEEFQTPQRVRLSYVRLKSSDISDSIEVSDDELQALYARKKASLKSKEQRRASHILFQVASDADQETVDKVKQEAEKVLARIRAGEDFGKLAAEYSDDPGSAKKGGDLDYFSAGTMVPEFDKAAFSMSVGEVSEPIRTQFGYHIIKLTDIKAGKIPPLEEVRDQLVKEIRQRQVDDLYYEQYEQLTDLAYENPDSLQASADGLGLEIKTSDWITATQGEGIGAYPKVRAIAFSDDVLEAGNNSEPIEVDQGDAIVLRVSDRESAHPTPLEEVRDTIVARLKQEGAARAAAEKGDQIMQELGGDKSMKDIAQADELEFKEADKVGRNAPGYKPELIGAVFRLPRPADDQALTEGIALANGDYVVVQLKAVTDADPANMTEAMRTQLKQGFEDMRHNMVLSTLVDSLRGRAEVEIPAASE
jgi:peptidyl-prolyl cis-trans isomerase D